MIWKTLLVLTVFGLAAVGAAQDDAAAKKDLDKLQGEWKVVSIEREGKEEKPKNSRTTVSRDEWTTRAGDTVEREGTLKLDPTKSPKAIDTVFTDGPDKGKTLQGIYMLAGDDWKVLYSAPGKDRPKTFPTQPGSAHFLIVLKRVKP
jgi:uncharacterized protein (TIGR03067 family)